MELNFKNINLENQLIKNSFIEKYLGKKGNLRSKEIEKHKTDSLKMSVFIGLFAWLAIGIYIENILKALAFSTVFTIVVFIILLQLPLAKKRKAGDRIQDQNQDEEQWSLEGKRKEGDRNRDQNQDQDHRSS